MKNLLNSVKVLKPKKNVFDLTHDVKFSCNMGYLVPTLCKEVVPGDKWEIACDSVQRASPLVAPMMQRVDVTNHYWFVPARILWPNWDKWIMGEHEGLFPHIIFPQEAWTNGCLADYLGIPEPVSPGAAGLILNAMPFAAVQCIWDNWYRDQNLQAEVDWELTDGDNTANTELIEIRRRAWEHDYFTSALPFAQAGAPVSLPVAGGNVSLKDSPYAEAGKLRSLSGSVQSGALTAETPTGDLQTSGADSVYDPNGSLEVEGVSTTINDLRRANALQRFLERCARAGRRYAEGLLANWGISNQDARLQRPEYITGTNTPFSISEVLSTFAGAEVSAPQGNMSGHGISVTAGKYGYYHAKEHGFIVCLQSIRPKTAYFQGLERMWSRIADRFQYPWPDLAHLGEQAILNRELWAWNDTNPGDTFGYTPQYSDYRFASSRVCADFRNSLDYWHMARRFENQPQLNDEFIKCETDDRVFAITDPTQQKIYCHTLHKLKVIRALPKYGTPMM